MRKQKKIQIFKHHIYFLTLVYILVMHRHKLCGEMKANYTVKTYHKHDPIWYDIIYSTTMTHKEWRSYFELIKDRLYINGLVQDCSNSSALAMELLQSCTNPSISLSWVSYGVFFMSVSAKIDHIKQDPTIFCLSGQTSLLHLRLGFIQCKGICNFLLLHGTNCIKLGAIVARSNIAWYWIQECSDKHRT